MLTVIITLFVLLTIVALLLPANSKNKFYFIFSVVLLFLLAAFRDGRSIRDYMAYVEMFLNNSLQVEISFQFINYIVKIFTENPIGLFIVYAFLGVYLKVKAIKEFSNFWFLSLLVYASHFYILHELTQIRVGVASGFFLFSIKAIYDKNIRRFFIFSTLAILFHYSSVIIFPLWFLSYSKIKLSIFWFLIPIAYIFYFLKINFIGIFFENIPLEYIQNKYNVYKSLQEQKIANFDKINVFNYIFLAKMLIYYLLIWKIKVITQNNKYGNLLIKIWGIGLFLFIFLASMPVLAFRVSELFSVVEIFTIPFCLYIFKTKYVAKLLVITIAITIFLINIFYINLII